MSEKPSKNNHFHESNFSMFVALDKIFSEIIIFNEGYQLFKFVPGRRRFFPFVVHALDHQTASLTQKSKFCTYVTLQVRSLWKIIAKIRENF